MQDEQYRQFLNTKTKEEVIEICIQQSKAKSKLIIEKIELEQQIESQSNGQQ